MVEKFLPFYMNYLGQWGIYPIIEPNTGIEFNCSEQYMMYHKALLFKDYEMATKIIEEKIPQNQQDLGRQVQNFNPEAWDANARKIVYNGNYLKFTQHGSLREKFLHTAPLTLVEASPTDLIWGIGFAAQSSEIHDRSKWRGKNWLGETLTTLRDDIIGEKAKYVLLEYMVEKRVEELYGD
jgi:ribA/ribD-fused uncharacterized protein